MHIEKYIDFTLEELAADPDFRAWCLNQENTSFWTSFLQQYPKKAAEVEQARQIVLGVDQYFSPQKVSQEKIEAAFERTLRTAQTRKKTGKYRKLVGQLQRVAAIGLIVALLAGIGYYLSQNAQSADLVAYQTEYGQQRIIDLPDGSKVQLNANSRLVLNKNWKSDNMREVWLTGEAFFIVEKKPATRAKFVVHTQELDVEVLGTQFNVNTKKEATQVVLEEGQIKLSLPGDDATPSSSVLMAPGELVTIRKDTKIIDKKLVKTSLYSTWKDGYLTYEEATLAEVLADVEATFGHSIQVQDSVLLQESISGALSSESLDELLTVLQDIIPNILFTEKDWQLIVESKRK